MQDWGPIILTFELAAITTLCLIILSIPLAFGISRIRSRWSSVPEALVAMPLVLPPTVIGFYLLLAFSPGSGVGQWLDDVFGIQLVFSFEGLVIASIIYSLPFMVQPLLAGFRSLPPELEKASLSLGKSTWQFLRHVALPNVKGSLLAGIVLSFAHTLGEFGVVLMIGGNIPGETRVASIAIYDQVEALNYDQAHAYSLFLIATAFVILCAVYMTKVGSQKSYLWR